MGAWTSLGGASLFVEARGRVPHGGFDQSIQIVGDSKNGDNANKSSGGAAGPMKVTGQLGQVMNESSEISLTYARLFVRELSPENNFLDEAHIHLNVPEGSVPKDGPSAGVTMTTALMSLALGEPIQTDLAMTGELTITGKVLKVGGIKEKVIAARREKVTTLILPRQNEADFVELKEYLRAGMTAHFVDHYDDVYRFAFPDEKVPPLPRPSLGQPAITVETPDADKAQKVTDEVSDIPTNPEVPAPTPMPQSTGVVQVKRR